MNTQTIALVYKYAPFQNKQSYENNMHCLEYVSLVLKDMGLPFCAISRADINAENLKNRFVITIGGDGTLLDASHYCTNEVMLGINSDPAYSTGALCIAHKNNFKEIISKIYNNTIKPSPLQRLALYYQNKLHTIAALNDILFCHSNPAAMSRFSLCLNDYEEAHRASGLWIATATGSTGGIFSSGADYHDVEYEDILFRVREPYWCSSQDPQLLQGAFNKNSLTIKNTMQNARLYIDGPHRYLDIALEESIRIIIADHPLWLFSAKELNEQRKRLIKPRLVFRKLLRGR
jgi:NAD+ kinase